MTAKELHLFLNQNNWTYDLTTMTYSHPKIPAFTLPDRDILNDPGACYVTVLDRMTLNGILTTHSIAQGTLATEVRQFLSDNSWSLGQNIGGPLAWTHPFVMLQMIEDSFVDYDPEDAFEIALRSMDLIGFPSRNVPLSGLLHNVVVRVRSNGMAQAVTPLPLKSPSPTRAAFMANVPPAYLGVPVVASFTATPFKSKCDCGADKCKTTHSHWCSAFDK